MSPQKTLSKELGCLQGTWHIRALELDGAEMPAPPDARVVIEGERFTSLGMGAEYAGTLVVDPSAKPPHLDMRFDTGHAKGTVNLGIYELTGDTLRLCLAMRGNVRPKAFATKPNSGIALETLVRGKEKATAKSGKGAKTAAARASQAAAPATELEGEFPMLSGVMDGSPMDASMVKWVKRVTHGNVTSVIAGPNVMMKAEFTLDPAQSPKHIDYVNLVGSHKGKKQAGIYKIEGGVISICVAGPGKPRPRDFTSPKGSGVTLTVWKRP
jgi:uncharacterized protein (TIGR03067 family)